MNGWIDIGQSGNRAIQHCFPQTNQLYEVGSFSFAGSIPAEGGGFSRAIKIRSTPSLGGEIKPSAPCRKIFRHVKDALKV
jgi:hypothetical protein